MSELTQSRLSEVLERFLKSFKSKSGEYTYRVRISQMIATGSKSLIVDFDDLLIYDVELANRLISEPDEVLESFVTATYEALRTENPSYAEKIGRRNVTVSIRNLHDKMSIRNVTTEHLDKLIAVTGIVVRTSDLKPLAVEAAFKCVKCGHINREPQTKMILKRPRGCEECDEARNFELVEKETRFVDYQVIRMQELPEELPPGQLPQSFDVSLVGDLVNVSRPGDRVVLTGVVRAEPEYSQGRGRLRLFRSTIEGNYVEILGKEPEQIRLTKEDEALIRSIASQPNAYERLIESVAPAIYGYETQKESILLMAMGAPRQVLPDGTTIRGDINVLFVGDPGTAKSELLKYAARTAPRGLYTSGRGTTAAGLTAAVVREKSGMMMLEAGAVVLADQGVASIDEFDKMRKEDRAALHECMEQQTVSVAKGGIVATLNARTSILAASNPVFGKYDDYRNIVENVNLPIPLLTRFDLIFVLRDKPDRARDEELAKHVLELHRKGEYVKAPPIEFDVLRKYLAYAKKISPVLTPEAEDRLLDYYLRMRGIGSDSMITVTPRQLEGLIRLATARARVMLHEKVTEDDAIRAVSLLRRMLETVGVDVKTGKVDLGVLHGKPLSERNLLELALDIFKQLEGRDKKPV
ncbi:MAG: minichromosome maintenance protein MCM, partial [Nitrososphaerales archaeon]